MGFTDIAKLAVEVMGHEAPVNISRVPRTSLGLIWMGYLLSVGESWCPSESDEQQADEAGRT